MRGRGLLLSLVLTLYITPVIYIYLDKYAKRFDFGSKHNAAQLQPE